MATQQDRSFSELVGSCREIIKKKIQKYKRGARCYWPELHLYCGICDLKTGLYIRSVLGVLIYLVVLTLNVVMLYYILNTGRTLYGMEVTDLEEYLGVNFTDTSLDQIRVHKLYTLMVTYHILWIIFKLFYIMALFCTIFAIYKKKPKILKVVLFINTLNWITDILISVFGAVLFPVVSKWSLVVCLLFEGYNILAIESEYKQLRGKSKLLMNKTNHEHTAVTAPTEHSRPNLNVQSHLGSWKHCETCSCNLQHSPTAITDTRSTSTASGAHSNRRAEEEKPMNLKDIEIIFNQDQLRPQYSSLLETP